jgi:Lon protease-like protein
MQSGNVHYDGPDDLPGVIPVFPLPATILLPRGQLPLNIFEQRYLDMIEHALAGDRIIGMIQPRFNRGEPDLAGDPPICDVGCAGRLVAYQETGDGHVLITLAGIARFRICEELAVETAFRQCGITVQPYCDDFKPGHGENNVDRGAVLRTLRAYLDANQLEADWDSVIQASNEVLVNALSMMSPYGAAEKQALIESADLKIRSETLVAITEIELAKTSGDFATTLQ